MDGPLTPTTRDGDRSRSGQLFQRVRISRLKHFPKHCTQVRFIDRVTPRWIECESDPRSWPHLGPNGAISGQPYVNATKKPPHIFPLVIKCGPENRLPLRTYLWLRDLEESIKVRSTWSLRSVKKSSKPRLRPSAKSRRALIKNMADLVRSNALISYMVLKCVGNAAFAAVLQQ